MLQFKEKISKPVTLKFSISIRWIRVNSIDWIILSHDGNSTTHIRAWHDNIQLN